MWSEPRADSALRRVLDLPELSYALLTTSNSRGHSSFILCKVILLYEVLTHLIWHIVLALQRLPSAWFDTRACSPQKKQAHSSAVKISRGFSFSQKPFKLITSIWQGDLNTVFDSGFRHGWLLIAQCLLDLSSLLQPDLWQALFIVYTHKKYTVNSSTGSSTAESHFFFNLNA